MLLRNSKAVYYAITTCLISPPFRFFHVLTYPTSSTFCLANNNNRFSPRAAFTFSHLKSSYYGYHSTTGTIATTATQNYYSFQKTTTLPSPCHIFSSNTQRNMSDNTNSSSSAAAAPVEANDTIIAANIASVKSRISQTLQECNRSPDSVRLVAVSKTKPVEMLMEAYHAGQRHFGENYAQELIQKAEEMPSDIKWHFIGPLQSNKAGPLVKSLGLKKLTCVETVSTMKLAQKLDGAVQAWIEQQEEENGIVSDGENAELKLGIYIQVNTSGEETKSGVSDEKQCAELAKEIVASCPNLRIDGLMTIGAPGDLSCFDLLVECRKSVAEVLSVDVDSLELSMGMSGDYVEAIQRGATSVRVGSTIFGARDYSKK